MKNTVVIVGAGFSAAAGLPATAGLLEDFTDLAPRPSALDGDLRPVKSRHLGEFWERVFGWQTGRKTPTFEDHFTSLDLAANTGHHLGEYYSPSKLRAIRRLSLHRVFETLEKALALTAELRKLVSLIADDDTNCIVSTNWDILIERLCEELGRRFHYGIPTEPLGAGPRLDSGLELLKLHGSANWCYCDDCRRLYASTIGKITVSDRVFLEGRDFDALDDSDGKRKLAKVRRVGSPERRCVYCDVRLSTRVATFSYQKAMGFYQFDGIWEQALRRLRDADRWIFIGYSLPEADFELRHLLKTAQLAGRPGRPLQIETVLLKDGSSKARYQRFFGTRLARVHMNGFKAWAKSI